MSEVSFFVPGIPVPKGSAKAFVIKGTNRAVVTQTNREKQKPWASIIGTVAQQAGLKPVQGAIALSVTFIMPRIKGHFGTGKNINALKPGAPTWHVAKPDMDKLLRCLKDSLTGIAWNDDSQVCHCDKLQKIYGHAPGAFITIAGLEGQQLTGVE